MTNITFTLRKGRTSEDVYKDTAIVNGYKPKVQEKKETKLLTEAEKTAFKYPVGTLEDKKEEQFTQEDKSIKYKLFYTVESVNSVSDVEFGKKIMDTETAEKDATLAGKATELRAKAEYKLT